MHIEQVGNWDVIRFLEKFPPGLNPLYCRMMEQIDKDQYQEFCKMVLSTITLAYRPLRMLELEAALPKIDPFAQNYLKMIIGRCGSFLTIREEIVYFIHQSAKDYLESNREVGTTTVDRLLFPSGRTEVHYEIVSRSLQVMDEKLRRDIYELGDPGISIDQVIPRDPDSLAQIRYACVYWLDHVKEIGSGSQNQVGLYDRGRIAAFLQKHFLHWLEALSLMRSMAVGVVAVRKLEDLLVQSQDAATDFLYMIRDANRFILYNRFIMENSPLQVYASALVFSPTMSKIRRLFQNDRPHWISTSPLVDENWNSCLQMLEGHTDGVTSVAWSRDGKRLASGSSDRTVRIWDGETGAPKHTLEGHTDGVTSAAWSRDGKRLASGSWDNTDLVDENWNSCLQMLEGHTDGVTSVAWSRDGKRLASGSSDRTVRIWDGETGAPKHTLEGHTDGVTSAAWSRDGKRLASGSWDN